MQLISNLPVIFNSEKKRFMLKKYFRILLFMAFFIMANDIVAQPGGAQPPSTPVGGGVVALAILGAGYAVKRIRDNK